MFSYLDCFATIKSTSKSVSFKQKAKPIIPAKIKKFPQNTVNLAFKTVHFLPFLLCVVCEYVFLCVPVCVCLHIFVYICVSVPAGTRIKDKAGGVPWEKYRE